VYDSIASNINSVRLQLMIIELDKGIFILPEVYTDYANVFNSDKTAKL
jgi:hypothetical protein